MVAVQDTVVGQITCVLNSRHTPSLSRSCAFPAPRRPKPSTFPARPEKTGSPDMAFSPFFGASWEGFPGITGDLPQCCRKHSTPETATFIDNCTLSQLCLIARCRRFQEARRVSNKRPPKTVANRQDSNIKVFSTAGTEGKSPPCPTTFPLALSARSHRTPTRNRRARSTPAWRTRPGSGTTGAGRQGQLRRRPRDRRPVP